MEYPLAQPVAERPLGVVVVEQRDYVDEIIECHNVCVNTRTEYIYRIRGGEIVSEQVVRGDGVAKNNS